MEHYTCIVDLVGCVGHIDDVKDFINSMPIKPYYYSCHFFLGAYGIYRKGLYYLIKYNKETPSHEIQ